MTAYTLDISKWRCGSRGDHLVQALHPAEGTALMNPHGNMCCLGQFAMDSGISKAELLCIETPCQLSQKLGEVYDSSFVASNPNARVFTDTTLSDQLMMVNDSINTSIESKIMRITTLLENCGHTLTVTGLDWLEQQRSLQVNKQ